VLGAHGKLAVGSPVRFRHQKKAPPAPTVGALFPQQEVPAHRNRCAGRERGVGGGEEEREGGEERRRERTRSPRGVVAPAHRPCAVE